jgi:hypothetical protein
MCLWLASVAGRTGDCDYQSGTAPAIAALLH